MLSTDYVSYHHLGEMWYEFSPLSGEASSDKKGNLNRGFMIWYGILLYGKT